MRIRNDEDFGSVLVCAVRYALGRRTYMPSIVADFVKTVAGELSGKTLTVIRNDIRKASEQDMLGDVNIDAPVWMDLLDEVEFYLSGGVREVYDRSLGGRIRTARKKAGLTQKELGVLCGVCHSYICDIERGKRKPGTQMIQRIASGVGVDVCDLVPKGEYDEHCKDKSL